MSGPLETIEEARAKCEAAAEVVCVIVERATGWRWVSDRAILVYDGQGGEVATIRVEGAH